jgi:tetratricopeptide (TPR) repeat protein
VQPLEPPDLHFASAAAGWLELGVLDEARLELGRLSAPARLHPEVLAVEWELGARQGRWADALETASRLLEIDGDRPVGWINRSYALHELRRTAEAREALLPALPRFPTLGVIPYNLACYACQLGQLEEARGWLRQAIARDGRGPILECARRDADLAPLHGELDRL